LRNWWPKLRKDGGLMLLHNVVGNAANGHRWAVASPKKVMEEIFPYEKYELMTLIEPNKRYQGSVCILKRIDQSKKPLFYSFLWGMDDDEKEEVKQIQHVQEVIVGSSEEQAKNQVWINNKKMERERERSENHNYKSNKKKKHRRREKNKKNKKRKKSWREELEM
jgi:hypothetical protein